MKLGYKSVVLLSSVLLATSLAGCASNSSQPADSDNQPQSSDAVATSNDKIQVASEYDILFSNLKPLLVNSMKSRDGSYLSSYYGIDASNIDSYLYLQSEDVMLCDTLIIIKATDSADKDDIISKINAVKDSTYAQYNDYSPEQAKIIDQAVIGQKGEYIYYVVASNSNKLAEIIERNL